ncbi:MAG: Rpn family recombination-promoting nuclease/putative transposase [Lachnospiraceae bacterium]|nr:Rpn family recombination-promoting nuclease/putative transposase [Lachnospiraceae bacterium]
MTLSELSNARLAAMANINPSQISRFIRGHRIPKPGSSVISQICRALSDQSIRLNGFQNPKGKGIYYLCDLHSSQPSKGIKRYDKLARTYQVTFCSYTVFPERTKFLNTFSLRHDKDNGLLSDAIHVIYVELSKLKEILKKPVADMTDLEKWAVFFRYADSRKYRNTVNEVIESKEAMQMATLTSVGSLLMNVSQDERERAVFRSRRMYQTDMQSNWNTAFDNGEKQGIAKRNLEIAKNLLDMEMTNEQIIQATGLSPEDIDKLRK